MKGFIIFENKAGILLYSKNYNCAPFTNSQVGIPEVGSIASNYQSKVSEKPAFGNLSLKRSMKNSVMDIQSVQDKNMHVMSSSLPPISNSNVSFVNPLNEHDENHLNHNTNIKLSKESKDYINNYFDGQDPQDIVSKFHTIMKITAVMAEEFKEMYPRQIDSEVKIAFKRGLEGFKSDSIDFILEHSSEQPITILVFYDEHLYKESIMVSLAQKLLDVFIYKHKRELDKKVYRNFTPVNDVFQQMGLYYKIHNFQWHDNPGLTFEAALPLVLEDTLVEYIKQFYLSLSGMGLQIPWIYIIQNGDLLTKDNKYLNPDFDLEYAQVEKVKNRYKK